MTFDATVNPVVYEGGEPVFIDIEYDTWNILWLYPGTTIQKYLDLILQK